MSIKGIIGGVIATAALAAGVAPMAQAQDTATPNVWNEIAQRDSEAMREAFHHVYRQGADNITPVMIVTKGFGAKYTTYYFTLAAEKNSELVEANVKCNSTAATTTCADWAKSVEPETGDVLKDRVAQTQARMLAAQGQLAAEKKIILSVRAMRNDGTIGYVVKETNGPTVVQYFKPNSK